MTTKNEIVQGIVFHELIGKRKAAMDQFWNGLERFQFLECIPKNLTVFEPVFVYMEEKKNKVLLFLLFINLLIARRPTHPSMAVYF